MNKTFEQKYIEHWASIANSYSPILLKAKIASAILRYKSVQIHRPKEKFAVKLIKQFAP